MSLQRFSLIDYFCNIDHYCMKVLTFRKYMIRYYCHRVVAFICILLITVIIVIT